MSKNGVKPMITAKPEPPKTFKSAIDALTLVYENEKKLMDIFKNALSIALDEDSAEIGMMSKFLNKSRKEYNEIEGLKKKMGIPGNTVYFMDKYLYRMYKYKVEK